MLESDKDFSLLEVNMSGYKSLQVFMKNKSFQVIQNKRKRGKMYIYYFPHGVGREVINKAILFS